ncbi:MAG: alpha-glucosidase C-terminal domain-containing protein [Lewinella sp.]|nr:alpha-glucosidase C-terminal domain-containing protein [Lewinella sp.]
MYRGLLALLFGTSLLMTACRQSPAPQSDTEAAPVTELAVQPRLPEWHRNATIYEVNLRHYTPEGTINAFRAHLPRLKEMGIDILWFMPVHPVSEVNRKGELGSPYAVGDYYGVNPDFGTMEDFKAMLEELHGMGMYAIIDWVPNHTGWDNPWITEHPDYYSKDADGNITDPINPGTGESWGWTDVADLNYDNPDLRLAMIDALSYWVTEVGIDGFRMDVAHGVPLDFWEQCVDSLYAIEPLFMLAEADIPDLVNSGCFIADYGWPMHHLLNEIARTQGANREAGTQLVQGNVVEGDEMAPEDKKTALDIDALLAETRAKYTRGYKMQFTSNHDENSWAGTEFQRMGDGHKAFAVLTATFDGMPLIYTGQESAMDKQLEFFTKDEVPWGDYAYADFYQTLFDLKHRNEALWNGESGGELVKIPTGNDRYVYAFTREQNGDRVVVVINLSAMKQSFTLRSGNFAGNYLDVFSLTKAYLAEGMEMTLEPWDYRVYEYTGL